MTSCQPTFSRSRTTSVKGPSYESWLLLFSDPRSCTTMLHSYSKDTIDTLHYTISKMCFSNMFLTYLNFTSYTTKLFVE